MPRSPGRPRAGCRPEESGGAGTAGRARRPRHARVPERDRRRRPCLGRGGRARFLRRHRRSRAGGERSDRRHRARDLRAVGGGDPGVRSRVRRPAGAARPAGGGPAHRCPISAPLRRRNRARGRILHPRRVARRIDGDPPRRGAELLLRPRRGGARGASRRGGARPGPPVAGHRSLGVRVRRRVGACRCGARVDPRDRMVRVRGWRGGSRRDDPARDLGRLRAGAAQEVRLRAGGPWTARPRGPRSVRARGGGRARPPQSSPRLAPRPAPAPDPLCPRGARRRLAVVDLAVPGGGGRAVRTGMARWVRNGERSPCARPSSPSVRGAGASLSSRLAAVDLAVPGGTGGRAVRTGKVARSLRCDGPAPRGKRR